MKKPGPRPPIEEAPMTPSQVAMLVRKCHGQTHRSLYYLWKGHEAALSNRRFVKGLKWAAWRPWFPDRVRFLEGMWRRRCALMEPPETEEAWEAFTVANEAASLSGLLAERASWMAWLEAHPDTAAERKARAERALVVVEEILVRTNKKFARQKRHLLRLKEWAAEAEAKAAALAADGTTTETIGETV